MLLQITLEIQFSFIHTIIYSALACYVLGMLDSETTKVNWAQTMSLSPDHYLTVEMTKYLLFGSHFSYTNLKEIVLLTKAVENPP